MITITTAPNMIVGNILLVINGSIHRHCIGEGIHFKLEKLYTTVLEKTFLDVKNHLVI